MKVLFLGGTKFTGPHAIRHLLDAGHDVTVFHRGQPGPVDLPASVRHIHGDKDNLPDFETEFRGLHPDVVVNMVCFTAADASTFVRVFDGVAGRAVVISSADVYRNYGRMHRTEPGPPDPVPLDEDAPLREKLSEQGENYNKTGVERIVREADFPTTIIRYPGIYGPQDPLNRTYSTLKRMDDNRRFLLLQGDVAGWRFHECYCENAGHALSLAVMNDKAAGRTYNVGDADVPTWKERAERIADATGWTGQVVTLPADRLPESMVFPGDLSASLVLDTTRIRHELGYGEVVSYRDGLARTIEWQRTNPPKEGGPTEAEYEEEDKVLRTAGLI